MSLADNKAAVFRIPYQAFIKQIFNHLFNGTSSKQATVIADHVL